MQFGELFFESFVSQNFEQLAVNIPTEADFNKILLGLSDPSDADFIKKNYLSPYNHNQLVNTLKSQFEKQYLKGIPDSTYLYPPNPKSGSNANSAWAEAQEEKTAYKTIDWKKTSYLSTNVKLHSELNNKAGICNIIFKYEDEEFVVQFSILKVDSEYKTLERLKIKRN